MVVLVKLRVANDQGQAYLGPGPIALLRQVDRCGSIRQAAQGMAMSYTKALRLLDELESSTGRAVVESARGGAGGGGTALTGYGRRILVAYDQWLAKVERCANQAFPNLLKKRG